MNFSLYKDLKSYHAAVYDVLMRHEVQNLIILGNIIMGMVGKDKTEWRDPANWIMATVSDAEGVKLTALMTPPHRITLYATDNQKNEAALNCLVEGLLAADIPVPGVMTEKSLAKDFTQIYTKAKGLQHKITMSQRIYELLEVNPEISTANKIRPLQESDLSFFPYWLQNFYEAGGVAPSPPSPEIDKYRYYLEKENYYVIEDNGIPVSMSCTTREMQNVCGVAGVYTPPYFRRKGYASLCVAQLSQLILDRGFTRCALYTDLTNPTSNSIYQKIGYIPVCDSLEITFE